MYGLFSRPACHLAPQPLISDSDLLKNSTVWSRPAPRRLLLMLSCSLRMYLRHVVHACCVCCIVHSMHVLAARSCATHLPGGKKMTPPLACVALSALSTAALSSMRPEPVAPKSRRTSTLTGGSGIKSSPAPKPA